MNYRRFFSQHAEEVARGLLGRLLVRNTEKGSTAAKIIQTGAYEEGKETPSRNGMKYPPATIYLMPYRGSYLLNIATCRRNYPSCVEVRQIAFQDKIIDGSGKIANFLDIDSDLDGIVLGHELQIIGRPVERSRTKKITGDSENCIGYFLIK